MTPPVVVAVLAALTLIAIAVACVATVRARSARAALHASEEKRRDSVGLVTQMAADSRAAGDVAHDLSDLLTAITRHTELLIANLDPSSSNLQDAREIRHAALSAARLTKPLLMLSGGPPAPTEVIDVNAVTARTAGSLDRMLGPGIDVALALDDDIKRIKVGTSHLEEIVLNIGIHARDAMPDGGRLTVATTMHTSDERDVTSGAPRGWRRFPGEAVYH
jgi:two-component system cell cycle sensor histidine kinase/response regulator CckA